MGYRTESHDKMNRVLLLNRGKMSIEDLAAKVDGFLERPLKPIDLPRFNKIKEQKPEERSRDDQRYYENFCSHDTMTPMDPPSSIRMMQGEKYTECADCGYSRTFAIDVVN